MKFTWEEKDFSSSDRRVAGYPIENGEVSIIGWMQGVGKANTYTIVSLRDGMTIEVGTLSELVDYLNKYNFRPVFDFLDTEKLVKAKLR